MSLENCKHTAENCKRTAENCKQTAEKCKQIFENWKNLLLSNTFWLYQHGVRKCLVLEIEQFKKVNFDLGHPVW